MQVAAEIPYESEHPKHECGVAAIYDARAQNIGHTLVNMLVTLQHRGQDSAGVGVYGNDAVLITGEGHVDQVFADALDASAPNILDEKVPDATIGLAQVRWSTSGDSIWAQPLRGETKEFMIGMNGEVSNIQDVADLYEIEIRSGESDTAVVRRAIDIEMSRDDTSLEEATERVMKHLEGGFAFVLADDEKLIAVRDPWATRPLSMGWFPDESIRFGSETPALQGATKIQEIAAGQIVVVSKEGVAYKQIEREINEKQCVFEYIYFMNKNSIANGRPVEEAREDAGRILAEEEHARMETMGVPKEHRHRPHVVIGVPNSAKPGAKGYAEGMGAYYYENALFKVTNKRSYIEKDVEARKKVVKENIQFNKKFLEHVEGLDVDIVDDSIVAGTTITEIIKRIRAAGARSVNVRITAPQIVDECNSGANIRYSDPGLLALGKTVREISEHIGADSLSYLSTEGLAKSIRKPLGNLCMSCITSEYHLKMPEKRRPSKKPQALVLRAA